MKALIIMSSIFLLSIFNLPVMAESPFSERAASEVNFTLDIQGDNFDGLQAIVYNNHPMQMFVSHPNSGREYRFEVLISEIPHADEMLPKAYLKVYEKIYQQEAWKEHAFFELLMRYNSGVDFSIGSDDSHKVIGHLIISPYNENEKQNDIE